VSVNQQPRGRQQIPITQELIQRVAAYVTQGGGMSLYPAQNDTFAFPDDCDSTHPWNCDFPLPSNFQNILSARLTWKLRAYRTFNTITGTNTGNESVGHVHGTGGETGHSHNHSHTIPIDSPAVGQAVSFNGAGTNLSSGSGGANTAAINANAAGSSGHNHGNTGGVSADHTHPLNLAQTLGITEAAAPVNPAITITVDGTDVTSKVGGPFNNDVIELDIRPYIGKAAGALHLVSLQPNQNCRVHGILKLAYTVSPALR
jgi:hypothetical protein